MDDSASLENAYRKAFKFLTIIMLPMVVAMIFFSEEFITLLLGDKFLPAVPAFKVLSIVFGLMFVSVLLLRILTALGRQQFGTLCIGIALMINVLLDVILIPRMGFMGATWATLLAEIVLITAAFFYVTKYLTPLSLTKILYGPCGGAVLMALCCMWLLHSSLLTKVLFFLPLSLLIYLAYLVVTKTLTAEEYQWFRSILKNLRGRALQG